MKSLKHLYLKLTLSLLLVISLMTGCFGGPENGALPAAPSESTAAESIPEENPAAENSDPGDAASHALKEKAQQVQADYDRLMKDVFLDEVDESLITLHYTLADPAALGITDYDRTLGTISLEESRQTLADIKSLKVQLDTIDSRLLRKDQLLTHRILSAYLNTQLDSEGLELYEQPLSSSLGIQAQLPILLSEYAFYSTQDVEDYLELLGSVDTYFDSIIAFEQQKTEAGLGLCDTVIDRIIQSCKAYILDADHSFMTETFSSRLEGLEGLSREEKAAYEEKHRTAINEAFVPAYEALMAGLEPLKGKGDNDMGLYYLPQGRDYYTYLVNSVTGTSYGDIPALKKAMNDQMLDDLAAMDELLAENPSLAEKMYSYSFELTDPDLILADLEEQCSEDFPAIQDYECTIKDVPEALEGILSPAFYLTVPIDRPQDNSIYINNGSTSTSRSLYSTMAHEGYPGHMYQTLYFNQSGSCDLRKLLSFGSYSEGWATYVEYYSYELDNGLPEGLGELLRHNSAFTLALYGILDINIHYDGWNIDQVQDYLKQYFHISDPSVVTTIYYDIVENPANYLEYYVGYLEILEMQREAQKTLGTDYSNLEFNRFLLDMGPAPFHVIRGYFSEWLTEMNQS